MNRRNFLKGLGVTIAGTSIAPSVLSMGYTYDTIFVVDVSASMPVAQIQKIILEASKHNGLLITFDAKVLEVIKLADLSPHTKLKIGGGTCLTCVDEYFKEHDLKPRKTVVFTDGFFFHNGWGNLPANTEFIIVGNDKAKPPYGNVTYMEAA